MYVGIYEREITPPVGCDMPGYYSQRLSQGILDKLYAKAVVISPDDKNMENAIALISIDMLSLKADLCAGVLERAEKLCGIKKNNISLTATHTHLGMPSGGTFSKRDDDVMNLLPKYVADAVLGAKMNLTECDIYFGTGEVKGLCFNRDYYIDDGSICTNPGALKDHIFKPYSGVNESLPIVSFKNKNGELIGILWEYACHQDCVGGLMVSGDYSSIVSKELKKVYGENFVSIYFPGASGDINNIDFIGGNTPDYVTMGKKLADESVKVLGSSEKIEGENIVCRRDELKFTIRRATKEEIEYAKKVVEDPSILPPKKVMLGDTIYKLLLDFEEKMENSLPYSIMPIKAMSVGELLLFFLPGELYHQYESKVREAFKGRKIFFSQLSNIGGGYFPVPELFGTYVYPTMLCEGSHFTPECGNVLTESTIKLANGL